MPVKKRAQRAPDRLLRANASRWRLSKRIVEGKRERSAEMLAVVEQLDANALSLRIIARAEEERTEVSAEQLRELVATSRDVAWAVGELTDAVISSFGRR
jgi:BioD-like phosphotransacetylase family protein